MVEFLVTEFVSHTSRLRGSYGGRAVRANNCGYHFVPAHQGSTFGLPEGGAIVHCSDALLLVGEQSLDHERLHARIMEPRRERPPQIV